MELDISTYFKVIQSSSLANQSEIRSFLKGGQFDDNEFQVDNLQQKIFEISAGGSIPSIDIFDFFQVDAGDVTLVHVQVFNADPAQYNLNDIRFSITVGDVDFGDMSQFTLANLKNFSSNIILTNVDVPISTDYPDRKAVVIIYLGSIIS